MNNIALKVKATGTVRQSSLKGCLTEARELSIRLNIPVELSYFSNYTFLITSETTDDDIIKMIPERIVIPV